MAKLRVRQGRSTLAIAAGLAVLLTLAAAAIAQVSLLDQVGSAGTGAGELAFSTDGGDSADVAIDESGRLYVADTANSRVSVFSPSGGFIRAFGWDVIPGNAETGLEVCTQSTGCKSGEAGGGVGQFMNPSGVAIDGSGNLFVADTATHRINVFTPAGGFVRAFGWDVIPGNAETGLEVCTSSTGCKSGQFGDAAGQVDTPTGLAIDDSGSVYVGDQDNHRISVFTGSGEFIRAFGWDVIPGNADTELEVCTEATDCQIGASGGGAGQLNDPMGVALNGAGGLFVADRDNARISVFGTGGSFVRAFGWGVDGGAGLEVCTTATGCQAGDPGGGPGQVNFPTGVAVDGSGDFYVADRFNNRVDVFRGNGGFIRAFGWNVIPANSDIEFEVCTAGTGCKPGDAGAGDGQLDLPEGLESDCRSGIWVTDGGNNRVQRFGEAGTSPPPCPAVVPPGPAPTPPGGNPPPVGQQLFCKGVRVTGVGTSAADVIPGTRRRDVIRAFGGNDLVRGFRGNDLICGGNGNDRLFGGRGRDKLVGGKGRDRLSGGGAIDSLLGGPGGDFLRGGRGLDVLRGGPGSDSQRQ